MARASLKTERVNVALKKKQHPFCPFKVLMQKTYNLLPQTTTGARLIKDRPVCVCSHSKQTPDAEHTKSTRFRYFLSP